MTNLKSISQFVTDMKRAAYISAFITALFILVEVPVVIFYILTKFIVIHLSVLAGYVITWLIMALWNQLTSTKEQSK